MTERPLLVIVSGAPAAGKTTLARIIGAQLRLPYIGKDELKEAITDRIGAPSDVAASQRLGLPAYEVLFGIGRRMLEAGHGLVIESNFRRGMSEPELRPLVAMSDARLVNCAADPAAMRRRYDERFRRGERHAAHRDGDRAGALADDLASGRFEPLELAIPVLTVRTDDGYDPPLERIVDFLKRRSSVGAAA
jgi:predicted kinase